MTDPLLSDARALAHRLGLIESGPHGENALKESAVRAIQAFALRQRADELLQVSKGALEWTHGYEPSPMQKMFGQSFAALATRLEAQAKEIEGQ